MPKGAHQMTEFLFLKRSRLYRLHVKRPKSIARPFQSPLRPISIESKSGQGSIRPGAYALPRAFEGLSGTVTGNRRENRGIASRAEQTAIALGDSLSTETRVSDLERSAMSCHDLS